MLCLGKSKMAVCSVDLGSVRVTVFILCESFASQRREMWACVSPTHYPPPPLFGRTTS